MIQNNVEPDKIDGCGMTLLRSIVGKIGVNSALRQLANRFGNSFRVLLLPNGCQPVPYWPCPMILQIARRPSLLGVSIDAAAYFANAASLQGYPDT